MASAPSQQGQDEAQRRRAALAVGGGVAAAAAAGAPAYAGAQTAQAIPAKAARVAALSAITAALVTFLTRQRQQTRTWLERRLPVAARGLAPNDVQQVIADEEVRDQAFAEKQAERMTSDLTAALAIPDPREREQRVQMILAREQRYARMRSEAMAARAFAAVDRLVLRTESPQGAFWRLDPNVKEHTAGCVGPQTPLAARGVYAITRRAYRGLLVEATTARGHILPVTPNHPVLTARGWIPADALNEGDYLFDAGPGKAAASRDQQFDDGPTVAEEVFDALAAQPSLFRAELPVRSEDFHGDGQHGHVDVVSAYGSLLDGFIAAVAEGVGETLLVPSDADLAQFACERGAASGRMRIRTLLADGAEADAGASEAQHDPVAGDAAFAGERENGRAVHLAGDEIVVGRSDIGRVAMARRYAEATDSAQDRFRPDAVTTAEPDASLAGLIAPDEVVRVRRRPFAGYVYNLSTDGGWYSAGHLVVHNCLIMGGRFWPWPVLDRVHPPRHPGCPCSLRSYGEAVKQGWLAAGDVLDVRDAIAQAAHVVMEFDAQAAEGLDRELALLELRDVLIERDLTTPDQFDRLLPLVKR